MINGVHAIIYSQNADKLRAFFRDVLEWDSVDAGRGWLIFGMPPAEVAVHPDEAGRHELFLMCDNIEETVATLRAKGVTVSEVADRGWGLLVEVSLPDGGSIGMYQPKHVCFPSPAK